jgi:hypothetical protein
MFYNLIVEIKNRIFLIGITWLSVFFIAYMYKEIFFLSIIKNNFFINYFIITHVMEVFFTYLKLSQSLANFFFIFYFCYHFFLFFISGLYYIEYYFLKNMFLICLVNLSFVVLITYFFGVSIFWSFFYKSQEAVSDYIIKIYFETKLNEFLIFYISLFHFTILSAFFFTVLVFFSIYIIRNLFILKSYRKVCHFCLLIIIIILIPSDLYSFLLIGVFVISIFEFFLFINFLKI